MGSVPLTHPSSCGKLRIKETGEASNSWWHNWLCLINQMGLTWGALGGRAGLGHRLTNLNLGTSPNFTHFPYPTHQAPAASGPAPLSLVETAPEDSSPRGTLASSGDGEQPGV